MNRSSHRLAATILVLWVGGGNWIYGDESSTPRVAPVKEGGLDFHVPASAAEGGQAGSLLAQANTIEAFRKAYFKERELLPSLCDNLNLPAEVKSAAAFEVVMEDSKEHSRETLTVLEKLKNKDFDFAESSEMCSATLARIHLYLPDTYSENIDELFRNKSLVNAGALIPREWAMKSPAEAWNWMITQDRPTLLYWAAPACWKAEHPRCISAFGHMTKEQKVWMVAGLLDSRTAIDEESARTLLSSFSRLAWEPDTINTERQTPWLPELIDAELIEILKILARYDWKTAYDRMNGINREEITAGVYGELALLKNGNDWSKANVWLMKQREGKAPDPTLVQTWVRWSIEEPKTFDTFRQKEASSHSTEFQALDRVIRARDAILKDEGP